MRRIPYTIDFKYFPNAYLTFKTDLTAATTSFVCGNAAASNDTAYGIGTSTPFIKKGNAIIQI